MGEQEIVSLKSGLTLYYYRTGQWLHDKVLHRDDGPAVLSSTYQRWYRFGKIHREDGPASIRRSDGVVGWYLDDKPYNFDEWCQLVQLSEEKRLELFLKYC